jgi:hypothetical protein
MQEIPQDLRMFFVGYDDEEIVLEIDSCYHPNQN